MSKAKFTKVMEVGITTDHAPFCVDGFCNNDAQRFEVCSVWGVDDDKEPCDQSKANAHLIAAAPEMYEFIETYMGGHPEAEKLLSKARGEHV